VSATASRWNRQLLILGSILILGGVAHSLGVARLYLTHGVPHANRVLLDAWIAEAQIFGGILFVIGARRADARPWVLGGALMVWSWALPFLPVLVHRARPFWVMLVMYSVLGAVAVRSAWRDRDG
jgi:hypothetical protein